MKDLPKLYASILATERSIKDRCASESPRETPGSVLYFICAYYLGCVVRSLWCFSWSETPRLQFPSYVLRV